MEYDQKHSETYTIRASEVSPEGKATIPAIGYLLQEVAGNNALALNFGVSQLNEQNRTWILHRMHLQMDELPKWRDSITIQTWPTGGDRLRAYRDFRILNSNRQEIGRCVTYWLMIDLDSRRPVRIPEEIQNIAGSDPDHILPIQAKRLSSNITNPSSAHRFNVRQSDLDMNGHVNNVSYIEWAMEALDNPRSVREIDIEFRSECGMGDTVKSIVTEADQEKFLHHLQRTGDQQTVAIAQSGK